MNLITHLLGRIPYQEAPRKKMKLPKRQKEGTYKSPDYPLSICPMSIDPRVGRKKRVTTMPGI